MACDVPESDTELEKIRDSLYAMARVIVERLPEKRRGGMFPIAFLPEDERYEAEERAAIHEFDGGLPRDEAERLALEENWNLNHRGN